VVELELSVSVSDDPLLISTAVPADVSRERKGDSWVVDSIFSGRSGALLWAVMLGNSERGIHRGECQMGDEEGV
jgi:hypothetical protein